MTEAEWLGCAEVFDLWDSEHIGPVATARQYRLFAACCCRRIWHLLADGRGRHAIETLERLADGGCTKTDREAALAALLSDGDPWTGRADPQGRAMSAALSCAGANGCDDLRLAVEVAEECGGAVAAYSGAFDPAIYAAEQKVQCDFTRDIFGNPFRPVAFSPDWRTDTALTLAHQMYDSRDFSAMPILADALQDAGCESADILDHCRGSGSHVRGCWVVDQLLDKK